jgi:hypothetical protein
MVRPSRPFTYADDGSDRGKPQYHYFLDAISYNIQK